MKTIEIIIDEHGNPTIEGKGFTGPECEAFTESLENALGDVTKRVKKPEYHRTVPVERKATR